jgi:hypothetical protein
LAFEYIKETELKDTFEGAKKFMLPLTQPFEEFERIARNKPHPGIDKSMPKVTDGTLASLIQEQPKRVIQQIPTGLVNADDEWLEIVAGFIFANEIIPNSNGTAALIQKCWAAISKALTYGSQPAFVQFVNRGDYFGTDFTLPYIKDVLLEPGKLSDTDSNVIFLRTWWTKNQIEAIIAKEKKLTGNSKQRKDDIPYETGWDLANLATIIETKGSQKDALQMTPNERNKQLNDGFYEIVHVFQRGEGAMFYSFSPRLDGDDNIVRRKKNPDPRGEIPIHYLYANVDLSNPLGRGSVEMSGGMQNLLDSEVQSYQYMRSLLMNPPLKVRGNISSSMLKYAPNALWRLGVDPNNDVEPAKLETASLESFPSNYGLMKSQILNLNSGGNDNAISTSVGDPGSSKTPQGVKANDARLGVSDNYMRKNYESWFEEIGETSINLYFAERKGTQELQLDDETAAKLEKLKPGSTKNGLIRVNYDDETTKLEFEVDASSSQVKDDSDQVDAATNLLELTAKFPQLDSKQGGPIDITELADRIIQATAIEDPEKIIVKPDTQAQPQQVTPQMVQQMVQQAMEAEKAKEKQKGLFEDLKMQMADFPEDARQDITKAVLAQMGIDYTPTMPTPAAQTQAIQASDSAVKVANLAHQQNVHTQKTTQDHANATMQAAMADAKIKQEQANLAHQQQTAQVQAGQAQQSHELATNTQEASQEQAQAQLEQQAAQAKQQQQAQTPVGASK